MKSLAVFGVISAFGDSSAVLVGWAVAAVLMGAVVLQRPLPASTRYDAATRTFQIAGSAIPLTLMMGIFCTKYVVAVALAMHPELAHQLDFSLPVSALYGAFSGIFAARGIRLWKLAMRQDSQGRGAAMAPMSGT